MEQLDCYANEIWEALENCICECLSDVSVLQKK